MGTDNDPLYDPLYKFWREQGEWSEKTFGPTSHRGPIGPLKHLQKEILEVLANPSDLEEYVDCFFMVIDATRRAGFTYAEFVTAFQQKLVKNKSRIWPDWKTQPADTPIEHDRTKS